MVQCSETNDTLSIVVLASGSLHESIKLSLPGSCRKDSNATLLQVHDYDETLLLLSRFPAYSFVVIRYSSTPTVTISTMVLRSERSTAEPRPLMIVPCSDGSALLSPQRLLG